MGLTQNCLSFRAAACSFRPVCSVASCPIRLSRSRSTRSALIAGSARLPGHKSCAELGFLRRPRCGYNPRPWNQSPQGEAKSPMRKVVLSLVVLVLLAAQAHQAPAQVGWAEKMLKETNYD